MKTAEEIAQAILQLPPVELAQFCSWFADFEANRFDAAIEQDALTRRLDRFADEALAAYQARQDPDRRGPRK
jgi:hypothetical protein